MSRDKQIDWSSEWGSAGWAAAQTTDRGKLEAELIDSVRASQTATQQMDEAAHAAMGVGATEGRCLDIIDRRGRLAAGELARDAGLTTGAVTGILDRLEAKGYVRRVPDRTDRRRILVEVTEKQRLVAQRLYSPLKEMADGWIERRTEEELRLLIGFNRMSQTVNERRAEQIRSQLDDG